MHPLPSQITKHQTSFFAHEVFAYFLPAQKVCRLAGERGESQVQQLDPSINAQKYKKKTLAGERGESQAKHS